MKPAFSKLCCRNLVAVLLTIACWWPVPNVAQSAVVATDPASLDLLEDIVVPEAVAWWPPAAGWYGLVAIAVLILLNFACWGLRRQRASRYRREALSELSRLDSSAASTAAVASLLKRTAMTAYGRVPVAALSGEAWVEWLNRQCSRAVFSGEAAQVLAHDLYRAAASGGELSGDSTSCPGLSRQAADWIRRHRRPVEEATEAMNHARGEAP